MKKTLILILFALLAMSVYADYTVDFEGTGETKTAYASGTVTLSGIDWDMTEALIGTSTSDWMNGARSARMRGYAASSMTMLADKGNGLGELSFQYRRYGTDAQVDWKAEYSTDAGASWIQIGADFTAPASDDVQTFSEVVNVSGNVRVRIKRATESGSSNRRLNIDDITLTDYAGAGNLSPIITNVTHTPSEDITSTTTVSVSAVVTDDAKSVASAQVQWGTAPGVYPNTINMTQVAPAPYVTDTDIPAQPDGTTVYYVVYAVDDEAAPSTSPEYSYTVRDPATTTIPYAEPFDADLGDCYVKNVSGASKSWIWATYSGNGYAYMNGYNSGDTEEDWLILPGIDMTAYGDLQMSFDTWRRFGADDANNYLKLLYSTDYAGLGDPGLATWTELPFTQPAADQVWTNSGLLDLSGITGTSVWLGFKYRYEVGSYVSWEIDNVSIEEVPEDPVISASTNSLSGFTYIVENGPSPAQSFNASGINLTDDVTITPPVDYELSLSSDSGYSQVPIVLPETGGVVSLTTIYVRLLAGLPVATYNGQDIVLSSAGATNQIVTCDGEVTPLPLPDAPVALPATDVATDSFTANWNPVAGATGYYLDVVYLTPATATDLFFSEYLEGSSNNKALEIFNGTGAAVDLSNYTVNLYSNGSATPSYTLELSGTLNNGDVYVIANSSAIQAILDVADITGTVTYYNGDDAVELVNETSKGSADIIGRIGEDPGSVWGSGDLVTAERTLVRKPDVLGGVTTNPALGFPTLATEWFGFPQNTVAFLGSHFFGNITYVPGYQNLYVGDVASVPVTGLNPSTNYFYAVRATNASGTSPESNPVVVTTLPSGIVVPGPESTPGGTIPPELLGPDTGIPAVVYTVTATGINDVTVLNPGWGVDWYCWIHAGGILYAGGNPIPAATPSWVFTGIDFGSKGEATVILNDNQTLPVELSSFTAVLTAELFVQLDWVVQSETDHLGYNILRGETNLPANAIKINDMIITSADGTAQGTQISYAYTDTEVSVNNTYYYWLESLNLGGSSELHGPIAILVTGEPDDPGIPPLPPTVTSLLPAYPNPFNPSVNVRYAIKEASKVKIEIYNMKGQLMRAYENDYSDPGYYQISWDGKDASGNKAASGVYLYRMTAGKYTASRKMVLAK